jgi:hypothetical protein
MMNTMILYIGLFLLFGIFALTGMRVIRSRKREAYQEDLDLRFRDNWSGRRGEELYAWYLVRMDLFQFGASKQQVEYVNQKIYELDKEAMLSDFVVTASGQIESNISSDNLSLSE